MNILKTVILAILVMAQTSKAPAPVLSGGNLLMVTANLERSIEFYRDFVGIPYTGTVRPFAPVTAGLADMYLSRGGQMRNQTLTVPGSDLRLEMLEFRNIDASPVHPRLQDPGATLLTFYVRDIDAVMARTEKNGVQVITPGGKPATIDGGNARAAFFKDPTGYFVEVVQRNAPPPANAPAGNVIGASLGITVNDTEETTRFYRDMFGYKPETVASFVVDKPFTDAAGVPGAQYRKSTALITGSNLLMEFFEYRGIDRTPMKAEIHDPGVAIMRLAVEDISASLTGLKAAGVPVVNWSGERTIQIAFWFAMGRDPNNFFFQLQQPFQPPNGQRGNPPAR